MIKKKKLTIIGAAALALVCSAGATAITASANATPQVQDIASFQMLDGASVRLGKDEKAIRFVTRIKRTDLETAVGGAANLANAKIVTMITPTRYLDAAGLTDFDEATEITMQPVEINATNYVKNDANIYETDESIVKGDYYYFNACLYDVEEYNLTRKFSAKSYLQIGETIVDYTTFDYEKNSRDVWDVAETAKNSGEYENTEATDEPYDYLAALSATFDVTVDGETITVKRGERLAWHADTLAEKLNGEDVDNLTYSYYRGLSNHDEAQSVTSDLTDLTAKYDVIKFSDNGDGTYSVSTGHTLNEGAEIVIPETFNGGNVTAVVNKAFMDQTNLTRLSLPETVTTINDDAFWKCTALNTVVMAGVTSIGGNAFYGCSNLEAIVVSKLSVRNTQTFLVPSNVSSDYEAKLDIYATSTSASLNYNNWKENDTVKQNMFTENVYYPSVNGICDGWVYTDESKLAVETKAPHNNENGSCTVCGQTEVTNGLIYEWNGADGYTLTDGRNASGDVEILGEYNDGIHGIASVTAIGANAFYLGNSANNASVSSIEIPNTVTTIGGYAFNRCTALTDVTIPESVISIGVYAFYRCTALTKLVLPASLTTISSDMLGMCTALTYLDMRYITSTAATSNNELRSCQALETVIVNAKLAVSGQMFSASSNNPAPNPLKLNVYVWTDGETMPDATCKFVTSYKSSASNVLAKEFYYYNEDQICAENTWYFDADGAPVLVENTEHSWVSGACEHCGTAYVCETHIYDENGKCTMCNNAYNTQGVVYTYDETTTSYIVSSGTAASGAVTILPYYNDGTNGEKAVTAIGKAAFYLGNNTYNTELTSIEIPNTVTSIGGQAFGYCSGLTEIVLPESVTSFTGSDVFWRCSNLEYISMTGVSSFTINNTILNCVKLKTLIVGKSFNANIQIASLPNSGATEGQCTVYVSATEAEANIKLNTGVNKLFNATPRYLSDSNMKWVVNDDGTVSEVAAVSE